MKRLKLSHLVLSITTVFLMFPDVFLTGASISNLERYQFTMQGQERSTFYSERWGNEPGVGLYDTDGAALQSEPSIQFMKDSIWNLESPRWNPYSGAGVFGLESMVDVKTSPHTLIIAALGGSNAMFHAVTLLIYTFALFFLFLVMTEMLGISKLGCMALGFVFILNGYFTANLNSNTNQTILYFPFLLYAALQFTKRRSFLWFLLLVFAYVLPLLVTFFPTTVMMVTSSWILAAALVFRTLSIRRERWTAIALHVCAPVCAGLLLAFLYLPIVEALNFSGAFEMYQQRIFNPSNFLGLISFFSPRTFFESYASMDPKLEHLMPNVIFHFGLVSGLVSALAIFSRKFVKDAFFIGSFLIFALGMSRIFGVPGIRQLIELFPFYGSVPNQYWWMVVGISFPVLFAYGFTAFERSKFSPWVPIAVTTVIVLDLIYIGIIYGLPQDGVPNPLDRPRVVFYLIRVAVILVAALYVFWIFDRRPHLKKRLSRILVFLIFFDLAFYPNTLRYKRAEVFENPPDYVLFLKKNIGNHRIANFASYGLPPELGAAYKIQQIEFFGMNLSPSYFDLCQRTLTTEHGWQGIGLCFNRDTANEPNLNTEVLSMLGVRYMLVSNWMPQFAEFLSVRGYPVAFETKNLTIFENPGVFPRAYGVESLVRAPLTPDAQNANAANVAFTDDDQLLSNAARAGISNIVPTAKSSSINFRKAEITDYRNTSVTIKTDFEAPGVLVLPDNWNPNWRATIDDVETYLGKVNQSFRGIIVIPGPHVVRFFYDSPAIRLGTKVSVVTLAVLFVTGLTVWWRRRRALRT